MISTKYRKEQAARKKARAIEKLRNPKKQEMKGPKNSHRMRMERRNKRLHQQLLFKLAERRRQIEKLKAIIEENKQRKLAEEQAQQEGADVNQVYTDFLNLDKVLDENVPSESEQEVAVDEEE
jgi:hypothetical protein